MGISTSDGITPAGAGKTNPRCVHGLSLRDHPRRCGENSACSRSNISEMGSPPQVRGKHEALALLKVGKWITPAGAGKTRLNALSRANPLDHPRRCGENFPTVANFGRVPGSPPQVRGKRILLPASCSNHGITPAGAGKTVIQSVK